MIFTYITLAIGLVAVGAARILAMKEKMLSAIDENKLKQFGYLQYVGYGLCLLAFIFSIVFK